MSQKDIYLVTCGQIGHGPNPGMTEDGLAAVKAYRHLLPSTPSQVICGTGRRHRETMEALGLPLPGYSLLAGTAEYYEQRGRDRVLVLADGTEVRCQPNDFGSDIWYDLDSTSLNRFARHFIQHTLHEPVVCCDRPLLDIVRRITGITVKSATVYLLTMDHGGHINTTKL